MNQESKRPVVLEDILRLKRAERPPAEFWAKFDRELRTKQLAALVEKQPWWNRLPATFFGLTRYRVPLGATAVLALSVLTVREYRPEEPVVPVASEPMAAATPVIKTPSVELTAVEVAPAPASLAGIDDAILPPYHVEDASAPEPVIERIESDINSRASRSHIVSLLGGISDPATAELIQANLAAMQAAEPAVARGLLGPSHGFEVRALPARAVATVEPLASMPSPSDIRRARISRSAMAMLHSSDLPPRVRTRLSQIPDEERLYDQTVRLKGVPEGLRWSF